MTLFSEQLKVATWLQHEQLEKLPFGNHLINGTLPLKGYILQLQAYYVIHLALENACRSQTTLQLSAIWREDLIKTPLIKADLEDLGAQCLKEMSAAQNLVDLIKKAQPIELMGILYVFEGSVMGAVAMYPMICRAYQLSDKGVRYFKGYGEHTRSHWNAFKIRFDEALKNDKLSQAAVISSAQATFEQVAALFTALWDNIQP